MALIVLWHPLKDMMIAFICCSVAIFGQANIKIKIEGIKNVTGNLHIALCSNEKQFLEEENIYKGKIIAVKSHTEDAEFDVPAGNYAILIYQDENGNGKLDKNILGAPKEKYGFSNNEFGPGGRKPKFEKASFYAENKKTTNLKIKLR